jgi:hypothetical protein
LKNFKGKYYQIVVTFKSKLYTVVVSVAELHHLDAAPGRENDAPAPIPFL